MNTITKKDLMEVLEQYEDDMPIVLEYMGCDVELYHGDCFKVSDINCTDKAIYLEFR
jgi:UDP-2,3-diacylglucosamine pyrophosphatase LpxH